MFALQEQLCQQGWTTRWWKDCLELLIVFFPKHSPAAGPGDHVLSSFTDWFSRKAWKKSLSPQYVLVVEWLTEPGVSVGTEIFLLHSRWLNSWESGWRERWEGGRKESTAFLESVWMKMVEHGLVSRRGLREVNTSGNETGLLFQSKIPRSGVSNAVKHSYWTHLSRHLSSGLGCWLANCFPRCPVILFGYTGKLGCLIKNCSKAPKSWIWYYARPSCICGFGFRYLKGGFQACGEANLQVSREH